MMNVVFAVEMIPPVLTVPVFPTDQTLKITAASVMMMLPMTVLRTVLAYGAALLM